MNKPKITFGKIQLNVKKDEPTKTEKQEEVKIQAAPTSGERLIMIFLFH